MKIRAQLKGDIADVKVLINHPMETGRRKDAKTGQFVPLHFIQHVVATINGSVVYEMQWSQSISTNPYFNFAVRGVRAGDQVAVDWTDNVGEKGHGESAVTN